MLFVSIVGRFGHTKKIVKIIGRKHGHIISWGDKKNQYSLITRAPGYILVIDRCVFPHTTEGGHMSKVN